MIREVNLISYLPPFIAEYKETNVTLTAENPEFILVWEAAERVLKNEFIETADEYGISKFEKLLSIIPLKEDTIQIRRARVQAGWFIRLPYTWRMLLQKLTEICEIVTIILENSYLIHMKVEVELQWQIDSLIDVVSRMLPCNMRISVRNVLSLDLENPAPMIKPGWINYVLEYRGKIVHSENSILFKQLFIFIQLSFWNNELYNAKRKYNGTLRYNAKRNYRLRVSIKSVFELYLKSDFSFAQKLQILIQYCDINVKYDIFHRYTIERLNTLQRYGINTRAVLNEPPNIVDHMSIETRRNVVSYDGSLRYNGTIKYNALYKNETVE